MVGDRGGMEEHWFNAGVIGRPDVSMSARHLPPLMRSRPSNLWANHRASEPASVLWFLYLLSLSLATLAPSSTRVVEREKDERFITAFIARRVLAARTAGWIGLWRLLNFDVTKSLFHSRLLFLHAIVVARGRT